MIKREPRGASCCLAALIRLTFISAAELAQISNGQQQLILGSPEEEESNLDSKPENKGGRTSRQHPRGTSGISRAGHPINRINNVVIGCQPNL